MSDPVKRWTWLTRDGWGSSLRTVETNLPRGIYDLSPWIYSTHMREQMRLAGRWKPNAEDLAWHLKQL